MEVQGWLNVCDIQGVPAHQLSCGQAAPTIWIEKYCALAKGKLWILEPEIFSRFFDDSSDSPGVALADVDDCSSINEEFSLCPPLGEHKSIDSDSSTNVGNRRLTEDIHGTDAQGLRNKSFLQKKIAPSIRRTRSSKQMSGKENRPFVDMTSLLNQGSTRQPESDVGTAFFSPTIETPDMLDLSSEEEAIVRPLHHSILGKEHCFEVVTVNGSRCFCCKSAGEREAWIEKIKRTLNPNLDNSRRMEHQLNLWVQEAKGIPIKKKYFCEICLDRQLYARTTTKLKDDNTTFWGEHFDFTTIPDIENITVHLYKDSDKKKKKDKDYVGLVNIPVQFLTNGQTIEKWYSLSTPSGNNKTKSGETMAVRIKAKFQSVCVLPMEHYKEFAEFISKEYMSLCRVLHTVLTVAKKDELSENLINIMHATGTSKEFLTELVMVEIANVEEESLIFRENTIATKAVEHFLRLVGLGYLHEALGDFVQALYDSEEDCEVDGSRLPANAVLENNQRNLEMCCEIAMCKVINSIKIFPRELREVFSTWRSRCEACNRPRIASRLVTASLFLRLLCPAILNPSLFGLANELPRPNASRTLTLVAKVIQNLANRSRFGDKEEYMKFMNGFVREQWDQMGQFIDGVSDATRPPVGNGFEGFIDLGYELAKLHAFFVELMSAPDQEFGIELGALPKILVGITDFIENPPAVQNAPATEHNSSRSSSHRSLLDKVAEDAHLSNANDSVIHQPDLSSTPFTKCQGEETGSLMDLSTEGFTFLADVHPGGQSSIPATGSFNNSNNSHRPSPAPAEILTELSASELNAQFGQTFRHGQQALKPPLSFSNPTYLQLHPTQLMRVISSPASLSIAGKDANTDNHAVHPSRLQDVAVSTPHFQQSGASQGIPQPLSFTNPLQELQSVSTAPFHSNSHFETVFTTQTVTYATNMSYDRTPMTREVRGNLACLKGTASDHHKMKRNGTVKMAVGSYGMDKLSSGGESDHEDYRSNDSLSSRPSSTSTGSTATHETADGCSKRQTKKARNGNLELNVMHKRTRMIHKDAKDGTFLGIGGSSIDFKSAAVATSSNVPVASALLRTGLQKKHSPSHSSTPALMSDKVKMSTEINKVSSRITPPAVTSDHRRGKIQHSKQLDPQVVRKRIAAPALVEGCMNLASNEMEDELVPGKPATSVSTHVASATKVRMTRKTRSNATTFGGEAQHVISKNQEKKSAGEKFRGGKLENYQRSVSDHQIKSTAFPPTTPEDPLSPEERTAQWILNNVAPMGKDNSSNADMALPNLGHNQSNFARGMVTEYGDVITRLKVDMELMRSRLSDATESNHMLKQREEDLLAQMKEGDRREARLQERVRLLDVEMQKQVHEKTEMSELCQRIAKVEAEQKREREELQGVIDEKDIIVSAQRRRIDSLEEANARFLRVISQMRETNNLSSHDVGQSPRHAIDVSVLLARNAPHNSNNNAHRRKPREDVSMPLRQPGCDHYKQAQAEHSMPTAVSKCSANDGAPTALFVNGEFHIGLSSEGSSSSSV